MEFLNLLSENTEMLVEATNIGIEPDNTGIMRINNEALQESFILEASMVKVMNDTVLSEGTAILSEGVMKNVYDKIIAIIKKMWAKIKEFFKGVRIFFDKLTMNEAKFADKYEAEIKAIKTVKIKGHSLKPDALNISKLWADGRTEILGLVKAPNTTTTANIMDNIARKFCGKPSSEFKKGCTALLGYKPAEVDVTMSGAEILSTIQGLADKTNAVKELENTVDASYKAAIAECEKAKKFNDEKSGAEGASDKTKEMHGKASAIATKQMSCYKDLMSLVNSAAGYVIACHKEEAKMAKKAAYKGIAESRKGSK